MKCHGRNLNAYSSQKKPTWSGAHSDSRQHILHKAAAEGIQGSEAGGEGGEACAAENWGRRAPCDSAMVGARRQTSVGTHAMHSATVSTEELC